MTMMEALDKATAHAAPSAGAHQRHFTMANLACYPAVNVPNGFAEGGTPTSIVFYAQPYRELALLALAKAYQDQAQWHTRRPAAAGA